jgi:hypothetical protein
VESRFPEKFPRKKRENRQRVAASCQASVRYLQTPTSSIQPLPSGDTWVLVVSPGVLCVERRGGQAVVVAAAGVATLFFVLISH